VRVDQVRLIKMTDAEFAEYEFGMDQVRAIRAEVRVERAHTLAMDRATGGLFSEYQRRREHETRIDLARCGISGPIAEATIRRIVG
jgi:hypothetical protein